MFWYDGRWNDRLSSTSSVDIINSTIEWKYWSTNLTRLGHEPTLLGWHNMVNETLLWPYELGKVSYRLNSVTATRLMKLCYIQPNSVKCWTDLESKCVWNIDLIILLPLELLRINLGGYSSNIYMNINWKWWSHPFLEWQFYLTYLAQ